MALCVIDINYCKDAERDLTAILDVLRGVYNKNRSRLDDLLLILNIKGKAAINDDLFYSIVNSRVNPVVITMIQLEMDYSALWRLSEA